MIQNKKIFSLLIFGLMVIQINTVSYSFLKLKSLKMTTKKITDSVCKNAQKINAKKSLIQYFSKKTVIFSLLAAAGLFLAYKAYKSNFFKKTYYAIKIRYALRSRPYKEVIDEVRPNFNQGDFESVERLAVKRTSFSMFVPEWFVWL